jgi:hypothetical protein
MEIFSPTITGSLNASGIVYLTGLTSASYNSILTYNSASGELSFTSSVGGGGAGAGFPFSGSAVITGSLLVSGSGLTVTGSLNANNITGSLAGTASWAINFVSASNYVLNSQTSSFVTNAQTSSMTVATASFVPNYLTTGSSGTSQIISGSLFINQNLTVLGSASITFISESTLNIGTNLITVNTINPGARFGGLAVIDSGSSPLVSASFLYDSVQDEFLFIHKGTAGGAITSSVFLLGPETFDMLGNETYLTQNRIPKGTGIEHLNDSNISDNGTTVSINSNTQITGSLIASNGITGSFSGSGANLSGIPASGITGLTGYDGFNVTQSFASSNTWTFVHNLGHQFVSIQTYDLNFDEIIPQNIDLFNNNTAVITFPTLESGYALAVVGGGTITNTIVNGSVNTNSFATTGSNTFIGNQLITGSLQVTSGTIIGSLIGNADTATTASFAQTASFVRNAQTASFVVTAQTASYVLNAVSASFVATAQTASYVLNAVSASFANTLYNSDGTITSARTLTLGNNSLTIAGLINNNRFHANGHLSLGTTADSGDDLYVSGSAAVDGAVSITNSAQVPLQVISGSTAILYVSSSGNVGIGTTTPIFGLDVNGIGRFTSALTVTGSTNMGAGTAASSAILQITSTTQGFLPPRMTTAQRNAISSPAQGLYVYDTNLVRPQVYNGTNWQPLIGPNSAGITTVSGSLVVTGSLVINPTGSFTLPLTSSASPATGSAYWSGSFLFIYNGTRYMSASFV